MSKKSKHKNQVGDSAWFVRLCGEIIHDLASYGISQEKDLTICRFVPQDYVHVVNSEEVSSILHGLLVQKLHVSVDEKWRIRLKNIDYLKRYV